MKHTRLIFPSALVAGIFVFGAVSCKRPPTLAETIYGLCQKQLLSQLRAPSTAVIPDLEEEGVVTTPSIDNPEFAMYTFRSYVDAQNGFGAMIRSTWTCDFTGDPTDKPLIFVRIEG